MFQEVKSKIVVCDCCGEKYEDGNGLCCYLGDDDGSMIEQEALESDWIEVCGKHYCPNCWEVKEDDYYHTKDGKVWDIDEEKEIVL